MVIFHGYVSHNQMVLLEGWSSPLMGKSMMFRHVENMATCSNDSKRRPQTIERKRTLPTTWFPRTLPTSACPISARTENKTRAEGFLSEAEKHHRAPRPFDCTFQHWNPPFSDLSWSEDILSKMVLGYPSITHKSISLSEFKRQNELKWISSLPWSTTLLCAQGSHWQP